MKLVLLYICMSLCTCFVAFSQKKVLNVVGINMRVSDSMDEDARQKKGLDNQTQNTALEAVNKEQTTKYKEKVKQIEERINKLSILLDVGYVTLEGVEATKRIKRQQTLIIEELSKNPHFIVLQFSLIEEMAQQVELLGRYLTGALLSGIDIYAMDNVDRKVITNFILSELRSIEVTSTQMYATISRAKINQSLMFAPIKDWINKDKTIVNEIIENAKRL